MAKYRVFAQMVSYVYADIEAEDIYEAQDKFEEMDGGLFTEESASWQLSHILNEDGSMAYLA